MRNFFHAALAASCLFISSFHASAQSFTHPTSNPFSTLLSGNIAWADFDLDGDMDAVVTGMPSTGGSSTPSTVLYRNKGNNQFEVVANTGFTGVYMGGVAWADMNNDDWPDLALCGKTVTSTGGMSTTGSLTQVYKNNGNGSFTAVGTFTGLTQGSVAWGDYNNDGFKDLLVNGCTSGNSLGHTLLYKNNGNNTFTAVAANLPGISEGEGRWGDYDNDGRLDILLTGGNFVNNNSNPTPGTYLYHNDGEDRFSDAGAGLLALKYSSGDFGDYDNDGRLDIALIGMDNGGFQYIKVYHNENDSTFADMSPSLAGGTHGVVRWGDFTQDGFADLILASSSNGTIYPYAGNDGFTSSAYYFTAGNGCDLNLTDLNLDGKLDFSVTGVYGAGNYTNSSTTANAAPSAPTGTEAAAANDRVLLYWTAPTDDHTAGNGLSYNLMIGSSGGNCNIISPEANLVSGTRYVMGPGNAGNQNWQWLALPSGTYYWKVQACDASLANSAYSTQGHFTIPGSSLVVHIDSPDAVNICDGGTATLSAETHPSALAYQWYKNGSAISGATGNRYTATTSGQYYVEAKTTGNYVRSTNTITVNASPEVGPPTASGGSGCSGTSITLSANCGDNSTYCRWYSSSGAYLGSGNTLQVSPGQTTNYQVSSYNSTTQCSSSPVTVTATVQASPPPPAGATHQSTCGTGDTLTLAVDPVSPPYLIYWYANASGGNFLASGNTFTIYDISAPVTYYAATFDPTTACYSPTRLGVTASVATPPAAPATQSYFPCNSGPVTLTATPTPANLLCKWYNANPGGTMFHTGTSYTTTVTDPVVYYVSAYDSSTGCESAERSPVGAAVRGINDAPLAQNAVGYGACRVSLFATTPQNATTCRWYADPFQQQLLYTGNNYLTPTLPLNSVTTYWVAGYNEDNQCVGSGMTQVSATIQAIPTVQVIPDQIYPVPNDVLQEEYNDVNLFTGDVNLTLPLASLSGAKLSYTLNVFYNSRSASITPYYTSNAVGGLGWKLLDYPKIAFDQVKNRYFFLDGLAAYALDTLRTVGDTMTLAAPGKYATMTFTLCNTGSALSARTWSLVNGKEEEYQFTQPPGSLSNNGYLWSLTRLVDAARTDTLAFDYNSQAMLSSISNGYDEQLRFTYSNSRLASITHYALTGNSNSAVVQDMVTLVYKSNQFAPNASYNILTAVETSTNINLSNSSGIWWYPDAPATVFEYYPSGAVNPGALKTVTSPGGAKRTYAYAPLSVDNHAFRPVTGIATDAGHLVHYEGNDLDVMTPEEVKYEGGTFSADGVYFQSNLTTVTPGKNSQTPLYTDANTSFEKGSHDDVFVNLDKDDLKKDYPLTGTHSLKFDGTFNLRATSRQFALDRDLRRVSGFESSLSNPVKEKGSLDSLTLSFFCLQTHQTLDVDFYLDFNFYDANKKRIDDWGCHDKNYELQNEQYGQWIPFELRFGVPSNAQYFDFEIRGGSKLYGYDFYMDEVTISGTESNVQGELQYFFFNGADSGELRHLPDAYLQGTEASMLNKLYYTGFESGQTWSSWLDISDGPADVAFNTAQRHASYNGTFALRAGDSKGDKATVKANQLPVPAGTDHVMLSFHYSHPQFPGLQLRFTWGCNNSAAQHQDLTLDSSYFIDPGYAYFQQMVPTNGASSFSFTIAVRDAGEKSDVNDFFLDDLTVQMLHGAGNLHTVDVQSPLLTGSNYLNRTFTDQFTELEVTSAVLVPATMNNSTEYVQLKELNGTSSAAAHSGIETAYNGEGMPTASTGHWARTNPDSSVTDVWSRTHFVYAKDIWNPLRNNYNDQIAVQWTEVSEDYFNTWSTSSGQVTQWNSFNTGGKTVWNPWRQFEMTASASPSQINAVVSGIASSAYTPPADQWIQTLRTDSISPQGDVIAALVNDSVPFYTQYSLRKLDGQNQDRLSIPLATFLNGSPSTCLYYGFEQYEKAPAEYSGSSSASYAFTGKSSATGHSIAFQLNYDPAGAGTTSYVMGAFIMPQCGTVSFSITTAGGFSASQSFTIPDSLKNVWRYYEWVLTPPGTAATLRFSIQSTGGSFYLDDFRFSPVTAEMNARVFDINTYRAVAEIGNNADLTRLLSNRWGALHGVSGPGEVPFLFTSEFQSRTGTGNDDNYNPNDPNIRSRISVAGGGTYFAMNDAARNSLWTFSGSGSFNAMQGFSIPQNSHVNLASSKLPANRSDWGISFRLSAPISYYTTPLFGVDLGGAGLAFSLTNSTNGASLAVKSKTSSGSWGTVENLDLPSAFSGGMALDVDLVFQNGLMHIWVNGDIIANSASYAASQFTQLRFFCNNSSSFSTLQVSNICLFTDATLTATFEDGLGNPLQQQFMTDAGVVISETIYDRLNRPILQTQAVAFAGTGLGYRETFITGINWETGYMSGDVNNGRTYIEGGGSQDKGYLYWRSIYLKSPENKVANQFNPGYDFALRSQTNWEKSKQWLYMHTGQIIEYGGYVLQAAGYALDAVDCVLQPETAPLIIAIDAADLIATVAQIVDEYGSSSSEKRQNSPITNYFYNRDQNLALVHLPNANKADDPDENQVVEYDYDFRNHLKDENEAEAGRVTYLWSNGDLLRFFATGNDRDSNRVRYIKYDRQERMVEQGFLPGNMTVDSTALKSAANDPEYPGSGVPHRVLYTYLWDGASTGAYGNYLSRGRLSSCNAWSGGNISSAVTYTYDVYGHTTGRVQDGFALKYSYDFAGNVRSESYPPFSGRSFKVIYAYNKLGQIDSVFTSEETGALATMRYYPDGTASLTQLYCKPGKGSIPLRYYYNAPRWLTSLTAGENGAHSGTDDSYTTDYFGLELSYNLLDDTWSDIMDQVYYNGNLVSSALTPGSKATHLESFKQGYQYDETGHLNAYGSTAICNLLPASPCSSMNYTFDLNGNLKEEQAWADLTSLKDGWSFKRHYDKTKNRVDRLDYYYANEVMNYPDRNTYRRDTFFLQYDHSGNLIRQDYYHYNTYQQGHSHGSLNKIYTRQLSYNENNRVTSVKNSHSGGTDTLINYTYSAEGYRIARSLKVGSRTTATTTYVRGLHGELLMEFQNVNGVPYARYYVYADDSPFATYFANGTQINSWFVLPDQQGSATALVNRSTKDVDANFVYDAYGALQPDRCHNARDYTLLFNGQEYDHDAKIYNFLARSYDPLLKVFLQPDPGKQNLALPYAYTDFDPVNYFDPDGSARLWGTTRKNGTNTLNDKIAVLKATNPTYNPGDLINFLQTSSLRSYDDKARFIVMMESNDLNVRADLRQLFKQGNKRKKGQPAGPYRDEWLKLKKWLREGKRHEMAPVSRIHKTVALGIPMQRFQQLTFLTTQTFFEQKSGAAWSGNAIAHGAVGSPAAHMELVNLLKTSANLADYEDNLALWMAGDLPGQQFRMHPNSYNNTLLKGTRTIVKAGVSIVKLFF